ncbi:MAG: HDIG domain-containing protein [Puniceicoccales bacterium]|jgi:putative nucleotidyltransferase with HDIG domain|nr:HDIG domain-containing protein [Puniceicoccales bacterium]
MLLFDMAQEKQQKRDAAHSKNTQDIPIDAATNFRDKAKILGAYFFWLFIVTVLVSVVCFAWNDSMNVQFIPGNLSKSKIVAEVPFEFESKVRTRKLYEQKRHQARNVYIIDEKKYDNFIKMLKLLDERMEGFSYEDILCEHGRNDIKEFVNEFNAMGPVKVEWQDVALLAVSLGQIERTQIFQECVSLLREIARDGVYFDDFLVPQSDEGFTKLYGFKVKGKQQQRVRTLEDALFHVRTHLLSLELDKDTVTILFKILKQGIKPNLVFDSEESKIDANLVARSIKPVTIKHEVGDVILEQNIMIDAERYEAFVEHQRALRASHRNGHASYYMFLTKTFLTFLVMTMSFIGLRLFIPNFHNLCRKRYYVLSALILLQVTVLRMYIQFGELEIFVKNSTLTYALYCMAPFLVASAIGTLLLGVADGLVSSVIACILYTLMLARPIDFCLVILFVCFAFVMLLKNTNSRSQIFACSFLAGLIFAASIIIHGILAQVSAKIVVYQVFSTFAMSMATSILTVIFLPILEKVFSVYTDISLLGLTDYRNPLLQQLQFAAPGTYQHSLVVSILSEQVAGSIKANKTICKTAALFHDLGKISKPEYFIENQNNYANPHDKQTPYISSLIIRNHVREGASLAAAAKLPRVIIDVICEHHGTTTTQFFHDKARGELLAEVDVINMTSKDIENYLRDKLDKNNFRYDGPRPRSKESAIIMLADSIEAASRSMKKVTHQSIENLIEEVFASKARDHQLDECPITLDEVKALKKAFSFSMIHILHSRISHAKNRTDEP